MRLSNLELICGVRDPPGERVTIVNSRQTVLAPRQLLPRGLGTGSLVPRPRGSRGDRAAAAHGEGGRGLGKLALPHRAA